MANRIDIIIVSKKRNLLRNIRIPLNFIYVLLISLVIITIFTLFLSIFNARERFDFTNVKIENRLLLSKLDAINHSLKNSQNELETHIALDNRERTFWQMGFIHPDIWSMGIGGQTYSPNDGSISKHTNELLNEIYESIDILKGKSYLRKTSLDEIQNNIEKNIYLWAHIPSINPVPNGRFCSGFGYRVDPIDKKTIRMHWGVDIGSSRGTPIHAAADGVVSEAGWHRGYGWTVDIDHGFGFKTRYAHCHEMLVNEGNMVKRGQVIATVGSTGRSISPHLHYEVQVSGVKVNPRHYFNQSDVVFD
jgi:hypothetical protein